MAPSGRSEADDPGPNGLRTRIRDCKHADETALVQRLQSEVRAGVVPHARAEALTRARTLVARCRAQSERSGTLDAFLKEFGLSNPEGIALMCLAEALLRVPDDETADRLIAEKIRSGNWGAHAGHSDSLFVNGSVWGLMLTGALVTVDPDAEGDPGPWVRRLVSRMGEPIVRAAVVQAMRILGRQYVLGRNISEALQRSRETGTPGSLYSFDMLGEGARTRADADVYLDAYQAALDAVGDAARTEDPTRNHGISVKLSALHPRFEESQRTRVQAELPERLLALARTARHHGLGLTIDAEEAARLELTMDAFERLARSPELAGWDGLGFVLQAYQKRAPEVADWLIDLARRSSRRIMVRLVKGAYWDHEIKHAQEHGLPDYPVFTRKANTDLCYEACAARLIGGGSRIFPQFATHNASTAVQVLTMAAGTDFELQRLHGMGELLYETLAADLGEAELPLRVYAPVGSHEDLLPYLVRRLLENGANSSFVNRFLDEAVPVDTLIRDPLEAVEASKDFRHGAIPPPPDLYRSYGEPRENARGTDLEDPELPARLADDRNEQSSRQWLAVPAGRPASLDASGAEIRHVRSPSNGTLIGQVLEADEDDVTRAIERATAAQPAWDASGADRRAGILEQAAAGLEDATSELIYLMGAEGGRTVPDAISELREAVDFCRYYAMQSREHVAPRPLPGPAGETNVLSLHGRGTFACISPWNFPLAIFIGQASAALAAGNSVLAKPAEQTPLVAARAVQILLDAGVPGDVLQLLPGSGEKIGRLLTADERVCGIAFTGSTDTARLIQRQLAARTGPIVPLIAETGGQNVLIADSTALPEQLVDAVVSSAFRSAGQRCSALRVLYLQNEIADGVLTMLAGAMDALTLGDPLDPATDIGPVIDEDARLTLTAHADRLARDGRLIHRLALPGHCERGTFFPPQMFRLDSIRELDGEVFGPILHVIRYEAEQLDAVLEEINGTGYGLTLGVHSRIEGFAREVFRRTRVGNTYVNRNMIGAVVGVQPFGGQGLSGTGPKAGGPNYLQRFAVERTFTDNVAARGGNAALFQLDDTSSAD